jgi:glutamyl endopeptidase
MRQPRAHGRLLAGVLLSVAVTGWFSADPCSGQSVSPPWVQYFTPPPWASQIFGTDTRSHVSNTAVFPSSAVGQVQAFFGNVILEGTGGMIGNKTVLTAAHVVYDPSLGGWPDSITFIPGRNGNAEPFGQATVIDQAAPQAWISSGDETSDMAVLVLDRSVGEQTGFFQIAEPDASFFNGLSLMSAGYPADLDNNFQYSAPGPSLGTDGNFLLEQIDTEAGQSGSPIWYEDSSTGQPRLVAVLKGTRTLTDNFGRVTVQGIGILVTPQFATLINDTLTANGDVAQNIPTAPIEPTPTPTPGPGFECGSCGAGMGQALLASALGWGTCFAVRRRWQAG